MAKAVISCIGMGGTGLSFVPKRTNIQAIVGKVELWLWQHAYDHDLIGEDWGLQVSRLWSV